MTSPSQTGRRMTSPSQEHGQSKHAVTSCLSSNPAASTSTRHRSEATTALGSRVRLVHGPGESCLRAGATGSSSRTACRRAATSRRAHSAARRASVLQHCRQQHSRLAPASAPPPRAASRARRRRRAQRQQRQARWWRDPCCRHMRHPGVTAARRRRRQARRRPGARHSPGDESRMKSPLCRAPTAPRAAATRR